MTTHILHFASGKSEAFTSGENDVREIHEEASYGDRSLLISYSSGLTRRFDVETRKTPQT